MYSVIIPCFNEAPNLPTLLRQIQDRLTCAGRLKDVEVILVNNGSTDTSDALFASLLPDVTFNAALVTLRHNTGYGHGLIQGLAKAEGTFVGWTHADGQTDFQDIVRAMAALESSPDPTSTYIKGARQNRPWPDAFWSNAMGFLATTLLAQGGQPLREINAQPNLFHRHHYEAWRNPPDDYQIELFSVVNAARRGATLQHLPVQFPPRKHGASSWNSGLGARLALSALTLKTMLNLRAGGRS